MRSFISWAAAAACVCVCTPVQASTSAPGKIYNILSHRQGRLFFEQNGARSGAPQCATIARWVIDTTTAAGQSMAATVLSAWSLGRSVQVVGTNECGTWGDTETADYVQVQG
jgi:hypothetical protein